MSSRFTANAEDRAATWAARLDMAPLSSEEARELQAWLDEAPGHEALLGEFQQLHQEVKTEMPVMARQGLLSEEAPRSAHKPSRLWAWTGGLAAAAALALAAIWFNRLPQEIATLASQRQEVTLSDGSHIALNARTSLEVSLRGNERHVGLTEGEAYFDVARDRARPFVIETPSGSVRVTGTKFNVRTDAPENLEVTVIEGSVLVTAGAVTHDLAAGDQLVFNGVSFDIRSLAAEDALDSIAWRDGRMICDAMPLRAALDRFARYHGLPIDVDPSVETLPLGGIFKLDDLDGFLRDLQFTLPVQIVRHADQPRIRILPREN